MELDEEVDEYLDMYKHQLANYYWLSQLIWSD